MLQRLTLLKDVLGLYLNRHKRMALLARVQASNLRDADRDLVTRIMRTLLKLPENPEHERAAPDAPAPSTPAARRHDRDAS